MSDDHETQRIIGQLQASVATLTDEVGKLRTQMGQLLDIAATAKGGWKTLLAVGSAAAAVSAAVTSFVSWIRHP
jgi:hypothetical protein